MRVLDNIASWFNKKNVRTLCATCGQSLWKKEFDGNFSMYTCKYCGRKYWICINDGSVIEWPGDKTKC